jgi:hypothetical protein
MLHVASLFFASLRVTFLLFVPFRVLLVASVLQVELDEAEALVVSLQSDLAHTRQRAHDREGEMDGLRSELRQLEGEVGGQRQQINELQRELQRERQELQCAEQGQKNGAAAAAAAAAMAVVYAHAEGAWEAKHAELLQSLQRQVDGWVGGWVCAGVLLRAGMLLSFFFCVLACWRAGVLAWWRASMLACWHEGMLAWWRASVLA